MVTTKERSINFGIVLLTIIAGAAILSTIAWHPLQGMAVKKQTINPAITDGGCYRDAAMADVSGRDLTGWDRKVIDGRAPGADRYCATGLAAAAVTTTGYNSLAIWNPTTTPVYLVTKSTSVADGGWPLCIASVCPSSVFSVDTPSGELFLTMPARVDGGVAVNIITGR